MPNVFYTDQCAAIHHALQVNFAASCHLLCRWHLARNIVRHLARTLNASISSFVREFYNLAERNQEQGAFLERWAELLERFGLTNNTFTARLLACKGRWARCYHHDVLDFGITTISRGESMNAWVKRLVDTRTRLATLFKVTTMDVGQAHSMNAMLAEIKYIRNVKKVTLSQCSSPLVKNAACILLDYPLAIFLYQLRRSNEYQGTCLTRSTCAGRSAVRMDCPRMMSCMTLQHVPAAISFQ